MTPLNLHSYTNKDVRMLALKWGGGGKRSTNVGNLLRPFVEQVNSNEG